MVACGRRLSLAGGAGDGHEVEEPARAAGDFRAAGGRRGGAGEQDGGQALGGGEFAEVGGLLQGQVGDDGGVEARAGRVAEERLHAVAEDDGVTHHGGKRQLRIGDFGFRISDWG